MDWIGYGMGWVGWDLCVGLLYEHRFAVLIIYMIHSWDEFMKLPPVLTIDVGKNLIYHLLNKNFRKYVKFLLNKKRVNETVNLLLPSQTPTSFPYGFR